MGNLVFVVAVAYFMLNERPFDDDSATYGPISMKLGMLFFCEVLTFFLGFTGFCLNFATDHYLQ